MDIVITSHRILLDVITHAWFHAQSFCSRFDSNDSIRSQFCTCHDSWAVMACAKLLPHNALPDLDDELINHRQNGFFDARCWHKTSHLACVFLYYDEVTLLDVANLIYVILYSFYSCWKSGMRLNVNIESTENKCSSLLILWLFYLKH